MVSQQKMIAEAVRPGQVETELRFVIENARCLSHDPNPLLDFFKNDRVIAELELDGQKIKKGFALGYFSSAICYCPCFWPHQLCAGTPISVCCRICAVDAAVKAHHLVLREQSIEYRVEKYPAMGASKDYSADIGCHCCDGNAGGFHEVYPLCDVSSIGVEPCQAQCCGANVAPDTMVLKVSSLHGGQFAAAAMDAPKNGADFAKMVLAQKQKQESNMQIPPDVLEAYTKYMSTKFSAAGLPPWAQQAQMAAKPTAQVLGNPAGGGKDLATQIAELKALKDSGALDDEEFKAAKAKLVG
uniref:SHOCT domain-containing protein n=1 Tax=Noctiluca scintillans TaxID=2966 RepID=A0A7S1FCH5_NOCSC|mmetsp:Transcript_49823/g.132219  ORF Transcript_49823/g.132219 Transcript_49823/m.132219 type:complete len:299 (+) Transcript_49823:92-988(+)